MKKKSNKGIKHTLRSNPETLIETLEKFGKILERMCDAIETSKEKCSSLLTLERGRPIISVCGLNEIWHTESFKDAVEWIGEHGGTDWKPESVKEMEIWKLELEKGANYLTEKIKSIKDSPKNSDGSWRSE